MKEEIRMASELVRSTASELARRIASKEVTSAEVVQAHLDRIEEVNGALNAVVQLAPERALREARLVDDAIAAGHTGGPLYGVPMTIKDSFETEGMVSTGGTTGRRAYVGRADATAVARLRAAGAILLGKTNTPELTLSFETTNAIYGTTYNPYDTSRTPGGSSGGAAAIVAAGGSPFELGSDFGGSIRYPAHCCGLFGIKPSSGRVPRTGHIYPWGGLLDPFQQVGPLARSVDDLEAVLRVISGPDGIDPFIVPMPLEDSRQIDVGTLRVAFYTSNGIRDPTAEVQDAVRRAAAALKERGARVEEARPETAEVAHKLWMALYSVDGIPVTQRLLARYGTLEPEAYTQRGEALGPAELNRVGSRWDEFRSLWAGFVHRYDAVLCPVNTHPALASKERTSDRARFDYTMIHNVTGLPGAVAPAETSPEGLPIGVQINARMGGEAITLAVARALETDLGGFRPPSI